jgi:hypothetical protein
MTAKSFFKKIGRSIQSGAGQLTRAAGGAAGAVLGKAAGTALLEAAPALLAFKTGGRVPGKKSKSLQILAHGGEYVLPVNVKPTKKQIAVVRKNKSKKK